MSERVALLGLGTMGIGMAGRLLQGGFPLTVWNRTAARADSLRGAGARVAMSPHDAARDATVIVTMLSDDDAARSVWLRTVTGAAAGALLIESIPFRPCGLANWARPPRARVRARGCAGRQEAARTPRAANFCFSAAAKRRMLNAQSPY